MKPYDKKIVLENGKEFYGYGFGADVPAINEEECGGGTGLAGAASEESAGGGASVPDQSPLPVQFLFYPAGNADRRGLRNKSSDNGRSYRQRI